LERYQRAASAVRDLRWERRAILARLAARAVLDAPQFGTGAAERLVSALVFSAVFFLTFLLVGRLQHLDTRQVMLAASLSFAAGFLLFALLALMGGDDRLRRRLPATVAEWPKVVAEKRAAADALAEMEEEIAAERDADAREKLAEDRERDRRYWSEMVPCRYCREKVERRAVKCPHCLEWLDDDSRPAEPKGKSGDSRALAVVLSLIVPGLGQLVRGRVVAGLFWMFLLFLIMPSVFAASGVVTVCTCGLAAPLYFASAVAIPILWILCALDAATGGDPPEPKRKPKRLPPRARKPDR